VECSNCLYACLNVNSEARGGEAVLQGPSVADYPRGARMGPRVIDDSEFVWMLRGQALFVTDGGERPLSPGRLLLVPPGVRHSFVWDRRRASRHGYVHFRPEQVGGRTVVPVQLRRMTERDPLAGLCAYLIWLSQEQPEDWEGRVRETLRFLLGVFASEPIPGDDVREALPAPLSAVVDHLRREWSQMPLRRVGVGDLASTVGVSRSYLNRLFQARFGVSAAAGLERLRCSRAESLLTRTDMTIGSIAHQCGFADLYHFSHRFARRYGVPPSAYRAFGSPPFSVLDHPGVRRFAHTVWG
jgi:AraC family transcriptional regulator